MCGVERYSKSLLAGVFGCAYRLKIVMIRVDCAKGAEMMSTDGVQMIKGDVQSDEASSIETFQVELCWRVSSISIRQWMVIMLSVSLGFEQIQSSR